MIKDCNRFVYYMVTKAKVYNKPTYRSLSESLHAMKDHMVREFSLLNKNKNFKSILSIESERRYKACDSSYWMRIGRS